MNRERAAMVALTLLAALGCLLGVADQPGNGHGSADQALDLVRLASVVALALALLLGPGVVWRLLAGGRGGPSLGFLPLPGLALLIGAGGLAWLLAPGTDPRATCLALLGPALGLIFAVLVWGPREEAFDGEERRVLLVVGCVLGLALAKALWSLGPEGELYAGTISRTLEVGDRSDSRISFHVVQLVATGERPYGPLASLVFSPYNFSSRGPLPGIASSPIVLLGGGRPPAEFPEQPWLPFDPQGFMAYRAAMMVFACTSFLAVWDLVRRLAGGAGAYFAVLLAVTTPFLVHDIWFTWPKLLAAALVLLAAVCVISRRSLRGGLLAGLGYLMHPVALLSVPTLGLIALWPLRGAVWNRPRIKQGLALLAGLAVFLLAWRLVNGGHYDQNGFLDYFRQAGVLPHPDLGHWLAFRMRSLGNTVVPLLLPLVAAHNPSINVVEGTSPGVVHFFFQYWNTLPFGVAIVFFPLLLVGLWKALRRWTWPVLATVVIPFALFTVYWGVFSSGMLREGLQPWVLTVMAVLACEQAASGFGWLRSKPLRAILSLRALEVLLMAMVPTLATRHEVFGDGFELSDAVAVLGMLAFAAALGVLVWGAAKQLGVSRDERPSDAPPGSAPGSRRG
ncbi:MAG TPA: glycosyltransferase family 39 protein [Solirubrobacterales bacterium]|nr:glycosyltransferase family 39 protein [Solirubrobacterales bacterium]